MQSTCFKTKKKKTSPTKIAITHHFSKFVFIFKNIKSKKDNLTSKIEKKPLFSYVGSKNPKSKPKNCHFPPGPVFAKCI